MFDDFCAFIAVRNCNIDLGARVREQAIRAQLTSRNATKIAAIKDVELPINILYHVWIEYPTPRIRTTAIGSMRLDGRCAAVCPGSERTWAGRYANGAAAPGKIRPGCRIVEIILTVEVSNFGSPKSGIICHPTGTSTKRIAHIRPTY